MKEVTRQIESLERGYKVCVRLLVVSIIVYIGLVVFVITLYDKLVEAVRIHNIIVGQLQNRQ